MLPSAGLDICSHPAVDSVSHKVLCSPNNNFGLFGYSVNKTYIGGCSRGRPGEGAEMDHTKIKENYQVMICATWKVTIGGCDIRLAGLPAYIAPVC